MTGNVNWFVLQVNDFTLLSLGENEECRVVSCLEVSKKFMQFHVTMALFSLYMKARLQTELC